MAETLLVSPDRPRSGDPAADLATQYLPEHTALIARKCAPELRAHRCERPAYKLSEILAGAKNRSSVAYSSVCF